MPAKTKAKTKAEMILNEDEDELYETAPSDEFYARVKPYNPRAGLRIQRIFVRCLDRVLEGGDGMSRPIEWVIVNREQALQLQQYRQSDEDPDAKRVFDIVDAETRRVTDLAEEAARRSSIGVGAPAVQRRAKQRVTDARPDPEVQRAKVEKLQLTTTPTLIPGAESFLRDPAIRSAESVEEVLATIPAKQPSSRWGANRDPLVDREERSGSRMSGDLEDLAGPEEIDEAAAEAAEDKPRAAAAATRSHKHEPPPPPAKSSTARDKAHRGR